VSDFMRDSGNPELEHELAHRRRPAPHALVTSLADRIAASSHRARTRRFGAVLAATGIAVIALGASGGAIYASSSTPAKKSAGVHIDQTGVIRRPSSSGRAQYGPVPVPPHPKPVPPPAIPPPPPPPPPPPFKGQPPPKPGGGNSGGGTSGGQGSGGGGSQGSGQQGGAAGGSSGGELPFTGLSLVVPVLLGGGLIGLGLIIRRRAGTSSE
jgi:uncharacterized membrane protein YgcG